MDSFGRITEILITVILLFLVPIQHMAIKQDSICQSYVAAEAAYFVDSVRNTGFVTSSMYHTFLKKLSETNQIYEVEMRHYKRVVDITEDIYSEYYQGFYTQEIKEEMEKSAGTGYELGRGDFFAVRVANQNKTLATKIKEMFMGKIFDKEQILVVYGGAIRDEIR